MDGGIGVSGVRVEAGPRPTHRALASWVGAASRLREELRPRGWRRRWTAATRRGRGRERVDFGRRWIAALLLPALAMLAAGVFNLHNVVHRERGDVLRLTEFARLRQTEKAAALGQLAAGVAHDFNNLLHAVLLGADGLRRAGGKSPHSEDIQRGVRLIERTAERGVALTRRMLDFARRDDPPDAGGFDPRQALVQAAELLTHALGKPRPVALSVPDAGLPMVAGDSATFETVIINLAVNARDAMPRGGRIQIAAAVDSDQPDAALLSGLPAVRIVVTDGGAGMDPATLARAGEAFFTTKPVGAGTGLGLSMARGFAQRVGGLLEIASEPRIGTTVTLRLPIVPR